MKFVRTRFTCLPVEQTRLDDNGGNLATHRVTLRPSFEPSPPAAPLPRTDDVEAQQVQVHEPHNMVADNRIFGRYQPGGELRLELASADAVRFFEAGGDYEVEIRRVQRAAGR